MTLAFRLWTELGAIEVRRDAVYPRAHFWWCWADLELEIGPFCSVAEALVDAVDALNVVRESIRLHPTPDTSAPHRA